MDAQGKDREGGTMGSVRERGKDNIRVERVRN